MIKAETAKASVVRAERRTPQAKKRQTLNALAGWMFISPVVLGIAIFSFFPMVLSLYYSFTDYTVIFGPPTQFGLFNYVNAFTSNWDVVGRSLLTTFGYTLVSVPLTIVLGFALALMMNQKIKGMGVFRTLYYIPCLLPAVVASMLWQNITDVDYGVMNYLFGKVGIPAYGFFNEADTALPSLFIMSLFSLGGGMVLWLSQLSSIPPAMYEAAELDGAGYFTKLFKITVPFSTPMIFYNLLINIIATLQTFSNAYMLLNNANRESMNFFVIHIYGQAFNNYQMGEACALSWLLFVVIGGISAIVFKTSKWVFYGEDA